MDESCSTNYTYISCCLIILLNLIYFVFTLIKLFIQHQRRRRLARQIQKMTDNINETPPPTTTSSRMATRSTTTAAAVAAAAKTTNNKNGYERLAQLYPHITDDIHLPTKWNGKEKAPTLVLQQNDLVVTYKGILI
jgi:hypothetical protein